MASNSHPEEPVPRGRFFRGPSQGILNWTAFFEERADWLASFRKRWHEGDPASPRTSRWRIVLGSGTALLAVAAIVERVLGG